MTERKREWLKQTETDDKHLSTHMVGQNDNDWLLHTQFLHTSTIWKIEVIKAKLNRAGGRGRKDGGGGNSWKKEVGGGGAEGREVGQLSKKSYKNMGRGVAHNSVAGVSVININFYHAQLLRVYQNSLWVWEKLIISLQVWEKSG